MTEHIHEKSHNVCSENEKRTLWVVILTIITMFAEILYGYITNSMALLADGYHMGTHALALGLAYIAYVLARKFSDSKIFINGTDKIGTLAGYTSSLFLAFTGIWIIIEAFIRILNPLTINFNDAILVASIGLCINLVSIFIMESKCHRCSHHETESKDYNIKAAYYHILADALTSFMAIFALIIGKFIGITILDAITGVIGGLLILKWSINLIKETTKILLDINEN